MGGKHGKNEAADAAAICEAVARPNMRFVPIKSIEQQGKLFRISIQLQTISSIRIRFFESRTPFIRSMGKSLL
jgi:transposase